MKKIQGIDSKSAQTVKGAALSFPDRQFYSIVNKVTVTISSYTNDVYMSVKKFDFDI